MRSGPEMFKPAQSARGALIRAGVAGLLLVVLLFVVLSGGEQQPAEMPVPPVVEAPQPVQRPGLAEPIPVEPAPADTAIAVPEAGNETFAEPAPDPVVAQPEAAPPPPEQPIAPPPTKSAPAPKPAPAPAAKKPAAASPPASASHMLQLGDFGPLPVAKGQLHAAAPLGYAGRIMHRVLIGPFATRDAARGAIASGAKGLLVQADGSWWVQAGVFSDADNAERLRASLAGSGGQVVVHGRAELGPFASRGEAERALAEVRTASGEALKEAVIVSVR